MTLPKTKLGTDLRSPLVRKRSLISLVAILTITFSMPLSCLSKETRVKQSDTPASSSVSVEDDSVYQLKKLGSQVLSLMNEQNVDEAEKVAKEAVELAQPIEKEHPQELALALNNLATVLQSQGDFAEARPLLERALKIEQAADGESLLVAEYMSRLAVVCKYQGDYGAAEDLFRQALALREKLAGGESASVVESLTSLADCLDVSDKSAQSLALYKRACDLSRKLNGDDATATLEIMNSWAAALQNLGKLEEATPLLEKCLQAKEKDSNRDPSDYADLLTNLAMLDYRQDKNDSAKELYSKAINEYEKHCGKDHILLAEPLDTLGFIDGKLGNIDSARQNCMRAARIVNTHISTMLPNLPLSKQETFLDTKLPDQLSFLLTFFQDGPQLEEVYDTLFGWKGLLIDTLRRESALDRAATASGMKDTVAQLKKIRAEIAGNYFTAISSNLEDWKRRANELSQKKDELEQALARSLKDISMKDSLADAKSQDLCKLLGADTVLVDIYQYNYSGKTLEQGQRYGAFIVHLGEKPKLIDLGLTKLVNEDLSTWMKQVQKNMIAQQSWDVLCDDLWNPIQQALPPGVKTIWICPDGSLSCCPWHLIPGEKSDLIVKHGDSAREIASLLSRTQQLAAKQNANTAAPHVLLAGGIDFNAGKAELPSTETPLLDMPFLPATLNEINEIADLARAQKFQVTEEMGGNATKDQIINDLKGADFIHLATHGIYLSAEILKKAQAQFKSENETRQLSRGITILGKGTSYSQDMDTNPLSQSAIALAGANCFLGTSTEFKGMLTAEEMVGLDLSACKHLSLSACETGLGREVRSQGVMGMRAAILAAGAPSLLISLWKVPDEPTSILMKAFYENLWQKKMPKIAALKEAQKTVRNTIYDRYKEPINWASWILVGE